eukprot:TRINITY_DN3058_c1_g1_i2.p1 TRINITY_DN3058_c1_g1~~TRINITY_DN3058_c1_g1_i2.p1  ORF type:complete len:1753 (+),score=464.91 TRINITY_DN3058_c1_g1_i2:4475-9733(+)
MLETVDNTPNDPRTLQLPDIPKKIPFKNKTFLLNRSMSSSSPRFNVNSISKEGPTVNQMLLQKNQQIESLMEQISELKAAVVSKDTEMKSERDKNRELTALYQAKYNSMKEELQSEKEELERTKQKYLHQKQNSLSNFNVEDMGVGKGFEQNMKLSATNNLNSCKVRPKLHKINGEHEKVNFHGNFDKVSPKSRTKVNSPIFTFNEQLCYFDTLDLPGFCEFWDGFAKRTLNCEGGRVYMAVQFGCDTKFSLFNTVQTNRNTRRTSTQVTTPRIPKPSANLNVPSYRKIRRNSMKTNESIRPSSIQTLIDPGQGVVGLSAKQGIPIMVSRSSLHPDIAVSDLGIFSSQLACPVFLTMDHLKLKDDIPFDTYCRDKGLSNEKQDWSVWESFLPENSMKQFCLSHHVFMVLDVYNSNRGHFSIEERSILTMISFTLSRRILGLFESSRAAMANPFLHRFNSSVMDYAYESSIGTRAINVSYKLVPHSYPIMFIGRGKAGMCYSKLQWYHQVLLERFANNEHENESIQYLNNDTLVSVEDMDILRTQSGEVEKFRFTPFPSIVEKLNFRPNESSNNAKKMSSFSNEFSRGHFSSLVNESLRNYEFITDGQLSLDVRQLLRLNKILKFQLLNTKKNDQGFYSNMLTDMSLFTILEILAFGLPYEVEMEENPDYLDLLKKASNSKKYHAINDPLPQIAEISPNSVCATRRNSSSFSPRNGSNSRRSSLNGLTLVDNRRSSIDYRRRSSVSEIFRNSNSNSDSPLLSSETNNITVRPPDLDINFQLDFNYFDLNSDEQEALFGAFHLYLCRRVESTLYLKLSEDEASNPLPSLEFIAYRMLKLQQLFEFLPKFTYNVYLEMCSTGTESKTSFSSFSPSKTIFFMILTPKRYMPDAKNLFPLYNVNYFIQRRLFTSICKVKLNYFEVLASIFLSWLNSRNNEKKDRLNGKKKLKQPILTHSFDDLHSSSSGENRFGDNKMLGKDSSSGALNTYDSHLSSSGSFKNLHEEVANEGTILHMMHRFEAQLRKDYVPLLSIFTEKVLIKHGFDKAMRFLLDRLAEILHCEYCAVYIHFESLENTGHLLSEHNINRLEPILKTYVSTSHPAYSGTKLQRKMSSNSNSTDHTASTTENLNLPDFGLNLDLAGLSAAESETFTVEDVVSDDLSAVIGDLSNDNLSSNEIKPMSNLQSGTALPSESATVYSATRRNSTDDSFYTPLLLEAKYATDISFLCMHDNTRVLSVSQPELYDWAPLEWDSTLENEWQTQYYSLLTLGISSEDVLDIGSKLVDPNVSQMNSFAFIQAVNKTDEEYFTSADEVMLKVFSSIFVTMLNFSIAQDMQKFDHLPSLLYNSLFDNSPLCIFFVSAQGMITKANDNFPVFFKFPPTSTERDYLLPFTDVLFKEDRLVFTLGNLLKSVEEKSAIDQQTHVIKEFQLVSSNKTCNMTVDCIYDREKFEGLLVVLEDISNQRKIMATLAKYLSPSVASQIINYDNSKLGGSRHKVTVLFADIRSYTQLSEGLDATDVVTMLNEYFNYIVPEITSEQGVLDKYIGDAVMAVWGVPIATEDNAFRACRCAFGMLNSLARYNKEREENGLQIIRIGIGLCTGVAVCGNIGSTQRMEYTVIGDTVNLASRLEGVTKHYKVSNLITESTFQEVHKFFYTREIDVIRVIGKKLPQRIYELIALKSDELSSEMQELITTYATGLDLYRRRQYIVAAAFFEQCLSICPDDGPSIVMRQRIDDILKNNINIQNDVWDMKSK